MAKKITNRQLTSNTFVAVIDKEFIDVIKIDLQSHQFLLNESQLKLDIEKATFDLYTRNMLLYSKHIKNNEGYNMQDEIEIHENIRVKQAIAADRISELTHEVITIESKIKVFQKFLNSVKDQ